MTLRRTVVFYNAERDRLLQLGEEMAHEIRLMCRCTPLVPPPALARWDALMDRDYRAPRRSLYSAPAAETTSSPSVADFDTGSALPASQRSDGLINP